MRTIRLLLLFALASAARAATAPRAGALAEASTTLGPYQYDGSGNVTAIGSHEQFTYDLSDRLTQATLAVGGAQTYVYDAFGNRTDASTTGITGCNGGTDCHLNREIDPATNRFRDTANPQLVQYDDAGHLRLLDGRQYAWDPVGMMTSQIYQQRELQYIYTADDERIAVCNSSQWKWTLRDIRSE